MSLTLACQEKEAIKITPKNDFNNFYLDLAMRTRKQFGMWESNDELIRSCQAFEPDDASMTILEKVWKQLNKNS